MLKHQNYVWYSWQQTTRTLFCLNCRGTDKTKCWHHCSQWSLLSRRRQPTKAQHWIYPQLVRKTSSLSGEGFIVKNSIASKLATLPTSYFDCIICMHLPLSNQQYTSLFSVYSSTLLADPVEKELILFWSMQSI